MKLSDGRAILAKEAVVSNADPHITNKLLIPAKQAGLLSDDMLKFMETQVRTNVSDGGIAELCSFIHIHAGIDATGLPDQPSADFPAQWAVIRDWDVGVEAPRNIVLCSMPSLIDPTMAPEGKHVIHAYTPATEPCKFLSQEDICKIDL